MNGRSRFNINLLIVAVSGLGAAILLVWGVLYLIHTILNL